MFRRLASLLAVSAVALALAGCSSGDSSDSNDGSDGDDDAAASSSNTPANSSGASGSSNNKYGSVSYEITGAAEAKGELPFQPVASVYSNGAWYLTFGEDKGDTAILAINLAPDGTTLMFGDGKITVIGVGSGADAPCTFKVGEQSAAGSSGSFECDNASGTNASGATFTDGIKVKGKFEARTN